MRTISRRVERSVGVVTGPACGFVEGAVDVVHEVAHLVSRCACLPQEGDERCAALGLLRREETLFVGGSWQVEATPGSSQLWGLSLVWIISEPGRQISGRGEKPMPVTYPGPVAELLKNERSFSFSKSKNTYDLIFLI